MFIDEIKVFARAGHGGKGCVAFLREAFRPKGGPSGGNGGHGGDVILEASHDLNNLIGQYYKPRLIAPKGHPGLGKGMDGKAGKSIIIKVPCGTVVWKLPAPPVVEETPEDDVESDEPSEPTDDSETVQAVTPDPTASDSHVEEGGEDCEDEAIEQVADLTEHGQRFILCKGGRGGLGNRNFATARRQAPRFAQPGETGGEGSFLFELKIMAEVGLVGYPNAGKSTLLTAISAARPKVAAYPFTTLHPQIGIVQYKDFKRLTVCDVPGLIDGAHENVGLGHAFLRHIQRCKILVMLLDMAGTDNREPWDDYKNLLAELEKFEPALLARPRLVVANKMDEPAAVENLKKFKRRVPKTSVLSMSAAFDEGVEEFKQTIRETVQQST